MGHLNVDIKSENVLSIRIETLHNVLHSLQTSLYNNPSAEFWNFNKSSEQECVVSKMSVIATQKQCNILPVQSSFKICRRVQHIGYSVRCVARNTVPPYE